MNTWKWSGVVVTALLMLGFESTQPAVASGISEQSAANELIVKYRAGADLSEVVGKHSLKLGKQIGKLRLGVVKLTPGSDKAALINRLQADPEVEYVQPNYAFGLLEVPDDPNYPSQWYLQKTKVDQALAMGGDGSSVITAVLDTGVKAMHPDLSASLVVGYNAVDNSTDTDDTHGHGTHVAGTVGAVTNNGIGVAGMAWNAKIMPVKVFGADGFAYSSDVTEGIIWAADNGARVINLSLGAYSYSQAMQDAVTYAHNKGVVVVAAAGNDNRDALFYPAAFQHVIAVSATDRGDQKATFSNYGSYVDVAAPGVEIFNTTYDLGYEYKSGTSMASPQVAGIAAMLLGQQPDLTPDQVEGILEQSAVDLGTPGADTIFGHGRVDAAQALQVVQNPPSLTLLGSGPDPYYVNHTDSMSTITYELGSPAQVTTKVYNSANQLVKTLELGIQKPAGTSTLQWKGVDDWGAVLADGTYTYVVQATGIAGQTSEVSGQLLLTTDTVPPVISNPRVTFNPFVTDGHRLTAIRFDLSEDCYLVSVDLYQGAKLVKTIETDTLWPMMKQGTGEVFWDGRDEAGHYIEGTVTYEITAFDYALQESQVASDTLVVEQQSPVLRPQLYGGHANPFTPTTADKSLVAQYSLPAPSYVTVKIFNSAGQLVHTQPKTQQGAGMNSFTWPLTSGSADSVPDGVYTYVLELEDLNGQNTHTLQDTVTVAYNPSLIIGDYMMHRYRNTDCDCEINPATYFTLLTPVKLTERLYDSDGHLLITSRDQEPVEAGLRGILPDLPFIDYTGNYLPDGVYRYEVEVVDEQGRTEAITGNMYASYTLPNLSEVTSGTADLYLGESALDIGYTLTNERGQVRLKIYDSNNQLVRTLVDQPQMPGTYSTLWDLKNEAGDYVLPGTYTYRLTSADYIMAIGSEASGTVVVKPAQFLHVEDTPDLYLPGGSVTSTISFETNFTGNVSVKVYDSNNQWVATLLGDVAKTPGLHTAMWDGKDSDGNWAASGEYTYVLEGVTQTGLAVEAVQGTIQVDWSLTPVSMLSATPTPFAPTGSNVSTISYHLAEPSKVTVAILKGTTTIKTVASSVQQAAGLNSVTWDGKNTSGVLVADNSYTYKITATNAAGTSTSVTGSIGVEAREPQLTSVSESADPFKVTGTTNSTIRFTLSEPATVTVQLFDSNDTWVRTLTDAVTMTEGSKSVNWNGKNSTGVLVDDGIYTYKITAVDVAGLETTATGTITADKTAPVISNVTHSPDALLVMSSTPLALRFDVSEDVKTSVQIYNSSNTSVKSLLSSALMNAGSHLVTWDGKNNSGVLVPDGTYSYKITVTDLVGFTAPAVNDTFVIEGREPVISSVSVSSNPFKVTGTANTTIRYTLSEPMTVSVKVYDSTNTLVRNLLEGSSLTEGAKTISWNGKNDAGELVEDGTYTYVVTGTDGSGIEAIAGSGTITTDKTTPVISDVTDTPDSFAPNGTDTAAIQYTLSEPAKVSVAIQSGSTTVKTLVSNVAQPTGVNSVAWDGKNTAGAIVGDGTYTYKITATDGVGFVTTASSILVVEANDPVISAVSDTVDPFRPTGSNSSTILYTLSEPAAVTIKIYDSNNNLVRTLAEHLAVTTGSKTITWNGKNNAGVLVGSDTYTYLIDAVDEVGKQALQATGTITVDLTAPVISDAAVSDNPFTPTGTNTTAISYTLSEAAKVSVSIYNSSDALIKHVVSGASQLAGTNSVAWNGKNASNVLVSPGTYTYTIKATDMVGNVASIVSGTITIQ